MASVEDYNEEQSKAVLTKLISMGERTLEKRAKGGCRYWVLNRDTPKMTPFLRETHQTGPLFQQGPTIPNELNSTERDTNIRKMIR